eukprot:13983895-Ditylum_brightwellii.AAC.1
MMITASATEMNGWYTLTKGHKATVNTPNAGQRKWLTKNTQTLGALSRSTLHEAAREIAKNRAEKTAGTTKHPIITAADEEEDK